MGCPQDSPLHKLKYFFLSWKNNRLFPVTGVECEAEGVEKREGVDADHPTTTKEAVAKDEAGARLLPPTGEEESSRRLQRVDLNRTETCALPRTPKNIDVSMYFPKVSTPRTLLVSCYMYINKTYRY